MIKLLLYIIILIAWAYVIDYLGLKSFKSIRDLTKSYKEFKQAKKDLRRYLK